MAARLQRTRRRERGAAAQSVVLPVLAVAVALALIAAGSGVYLVSGYKSDRITRGVAVRGVDLGGLTSGEARAALAPVVESFAGEHIILTHGDESWELTRRELGLMVDLDATVAAALAVGHSGGLLDAWRERRAAAANGVQVRLSTVVREALLRDALARLAEGLSREAEPARVDFDRSTQRVSVTPDVTGRTLDAAETRRRILESVDDPTARTVPLAIVESFAEPRYEDVKHINAVLGSFATRYSMGDANRSHNIALAAQSLDQTYIAPGETLSYNQRVGERTQSRGYKLAHVYEEGEVRDGIGGGICQVSSTLFNAALVAGLEIVRRHPHMMPVSYVETGRDATVDWGTGIDLVIRNNTPRTILLRTFAGDGTISCLFLGAAEDRPEKVEIVRSNVSVTNYEVTETLDPSLDPGARVVDQEGRPGHTATVHRIIKRRGQEEKRELVSSDRYSKRNAIVRVGPPAEEEPKEAPPGPLAEPVSPRTPAPPEASEDADTPG